MGLAVSISLSQVALALLAVSLLWPSGRPSLRAPLGVPVAAFAAWTIVSALASARPLESLVASKTLVTLGTIYVVLHALRDAAEARRFATALFALIAALALVSIAQVAFCPPAPPDPPLVGRLLRKCARAHGFYSIYMTLAGVLTLVLVSTLPQVARSPRSIAVMGPAWLVGTVALALTSVRGAWLGFAIGTLGSLVAVRRRALALALLALAVVVVLVAWPGLLPRVRSIADPRDDTARDRLAMLRGGLGMVSDHPLTGIGVGQVKHEYGTYAPPEALRRSTSHLHNTPLQILVERGVVGLVLWIALFAAFFIRAARTLSRLPPARADDRALVAGTVAAIAAFLVAGLFEYNFGDTEVLLVACTLMALPLVVERELDEAG